MIAATCFTGALVPGAEFILGNPLKERKAAPPPAVELWAPLPPGPQGASPFHQCSAPTAWAYGVEKRRMPKCERFHLRLWHSIVACRNCEQRTVCCSCVLEMLKGDPGDNRCHACFHR